MGLACKVIFLSTLVWVTDTLRLDLESIVYKNELFDEELYSETSPGDEGEDEPEKERDASQTDDSEDEFWHEDGFSASAVSPKSEGRRTNATSDLAGIQRASWPPAFGRLLAR